MAKKSRDAFDPSKDELIDSISVEIADGLCFEFAIRSYNHGPNRVQISRFRDNGEERIYLKLGRFSKKEIPIVIKGLQEIGEKMHED